MSFPTVEPGARALDHPIAHRVGATHGVELFFLWGNPGMGISLSEAELGLSRTMMQAWAVSLTPAIRTARDSRGPAIRSNATST